jgi:prepilin-type processing-associated H-X9-DG protein
LLLPALNQSKQSAQRVKCASNLRQLGLATQIYWEENENVAFLYRGAATNGGDLWWFGWLERWNGVNEGHRAFDTTQGALYPCLLGRGVEICPSLDYSFGRFKLKATGVSYGYGYNLHLSGVSMSKVAQASDVVLLADAAQVNDFQAPASPEHPMLEEFFYVSANSFEATAHFRHQGGCANAVFCDGHVDQEKPMAGSLDRRLPEQLIGRLGPDRLRIP